MGQRGQRHEIHRHRKWRLERRRSRRGLSAGANAGLDCIGRTIRMTETFAPIMIDGRNWFWQVTDHANQIYSSARNIYVAESDADYTAWKGKGNVVAPVPSEAELWPVLRHYAPAAQFPDWLFNGVTFVQPAFSNLTAAQVKAYAAD